jgi:Tol biopolymer transport system component
MRSWPLAFVRDGDIWVANGDGTGQRLLIKNGEAPAWSPDKRRIAFARNSNVWVASADGREQRQVTSRWGTDRSRSDRHDSFDDDRAIDISWDPLWDQLTFSHWEEFRVVRLGDKAGSTISGCTIFEAPVTAKQAPTVLWDLYDDETAFHFSNQSHPAWSRDGRSLAFARNGDIWLGTRLRVGEPEWTRRWDEEWDVHRLAAVAEYDAPTYRASRENYAVTHLSWSPDGRYLAYDYQRVNGSGTEEVHLLNVNTGHSRELAVPGLEPCFSPDGRFVAYEHPWHDGDIWVTSVDGRVNRPLIENGGQPAW